MLGYIIRVAEERGLLPEGQWRRPSWSSLSARSCFVVVELGLAESRAAQGGSRLERSGPCSRARKGCRQRGRPVLRGQMCAGSEIRERERSRLLISCGKGGRSDG